MPWQWHCDLKAFAQGERGPPDQYIRKMVQWGRVGRAHKTTQISCVAEEIFNLKGNYLSNLLLLPLCSFAHKCALCAALSNKTEMDKIYFFSPTNELNFTNVFPPDPTLSLSLYLVHYLLGRYSHKFPVLCLSDKVLELSLLVSQE